METLSTSGIQPRDDEPPRRVGSSAMLPEAVPYAPVVVLEDEPTICHTTSNCDALMESRRATRYSRHTPGQASRNLNRRSYELAHNNVPRHCDSSWPTMSMCTPPATPGENVKAFRQLSRWLTLRTPLLQQDKDHGKGRRSLEQKQLHHENGQTCMERLRRLAVRSSTVRRPIFVIGRSESNLQNTHSSFDLEEQMECLVMYKNAYATARLLHYAVWFAWNNHERDAASVKLVLNALADPNAKAEYQSFSTAPKTTIGAIHMAAGQGYVPAMEVLWQSQSQSTRSELVNLFSTFGDEKHYTPIHDAVFGGHKDATMWLLQHKAKPNETNRDGFTPLHWLAFKALPREDDLQELLLCLLRFHADVSAETFRHKHNAHWSKKTPLEMAALPGSAFPQRLMHLLAQSWHRDQQLVVASLDSWHDCHDDGKSVDVDTMSFTDSLRSRLPLDFLTDADGDIDVDVVCVQHGAADPNQMSQAGYKLLASSDTAFYHPPALELYIRSAGGRWEAIEHGCRKFSEEESEVIDNSHNYSASRCMVWAKLRVVGQPEGVCVFVLGTKLAAADDESRRKDFMECHSALAESVVAFFDRKAGPNDVAILIGDLAENTEEQKTGCSPSSSDRRIERRHATFVAATPALQPCLELGAENQTQVEGSWAMPLAMLHARGWRSAFSEAELGIMVPVKHLTCRMMTSQPMDVGAAEVFYGGIQDSNAADDEADHHIAVKATFHVQRFGDGSKDKRSFLDDLCLLADFNMDDAEEYARRIVQNPECHGLMRLDSQQDCAVYKLASLIFDAPIAAFEILDLLKVHPMVRDPAYHPIGNRSSLWNLPINQAMRCAYHAETTNVGGVRWPEWFYNKQARPPCAPDWHKEFLPEQVEHMGRQDHIYQVCVKVLLMPNLMDVDIMMALARTWSFHDEVFQKMTMRAIITCVWDGLMIPAYLVNLLFNFVEVAVLLSWGLTPSTGSFLPWELWSEEDRALSAVPRDAPLCWSVLFAAVLRDFVNLLWWFCMYCYKWLQRPSFSGTQGLVAPNRKERLLQIFQGDMRHSLWHPWGYFSETSALREIFLCLLLAYFVLHASGLHEESLEHASSRHVWLALNLMFQGLKTLWDLRLTTIVGVTVLPVFKAVSSQTSFSMVVFAGVVFTFTCLGFQAIERGAPFISAVMTLYRGLIFGDGDGLDAMNLKDWKGEPQSQQKTTLFFIMFLFSFAFYVCMLNLLIAVYNNEYDRVAQLAESLQCRERAQATCKYLFSLQKIRLQGGAKSREEHKLLHAFLCCFRKMGWLAYVLALGLCAVLPGVMSGCLLALVQVTWQAALMQSDWFPADALGGELLERRQEDLYLWIVHRHDYDEDRSRQHALSKELGNFRDSCVAKTEDVSQKAGDNSKQVNQLVKRLDEIAERSEVLAECQKKKLDALTEILRQQQAAGSVSASVPSRPLRRFQSAPSRLGRISSLPMLVPGTSAETLPTIHVSGAAGPTPSASSVAQSWAITDSIPASVLDLPVTTDRPKTAAEHVDVTSTTELTAAELGSCTEGVATACDSSLPLDRLPLQSKYSTGRVPSRGATSPSPRPRRSCWTNTAGSSICGSVGDGQQLGGSNQDPSGLPAWRPQSQQQPEQPQQRQQPQQLQHVQQHLQQSQKQQNLICGLPLNSIATWTGARTPPRVSSQPLGTPPRFSSQPRVTSPRVSSQHVASPRVLRSNTFLPQQSSGPFAWCDVASPTGLRTPPNPSFDGLPSGGAATTWSSNALGGPMQQVSRGTDLGRASIHNQPGG